MQSKFADVGRNTRGFAEATDRVGKAAQSAGKGAEKGSIGLGKFASSLARIAKYRMLRDILKALTSAFKEGLENVYLYSNGMTGEAHRMAASLDSLATANQTMKNQIGSAWGELLSIIQPVINSIMQAVQRLADWLSQLFAAFGGNSSYYKAIDASAKWAKNTASGAKSAKEMRRQLMGFDEINRLDKPIEPSGGGGGATKKDPSKMFEYTKIADNIKKIAETIQQNLPLIELALGGGMLALGAILAFSGANIPRGLALMAAGAVTMANAVNLDWSNIPTKTQETFANIAMIIGGALLALGVVLLFAGHPMVGMGLVLAGLSSFAVGSLAWGKINGQVKEQLTAILAIGALLFVALGVVLLFAGHPGIGIALLIAGGMMGVAAIVLNWDYILDHLKTSWKNIKTWWHEHVSKYLTIEYWDSLLGDGILAAVEGFGQKLEQFLQPVVDWLDKLFAPRSMPLQVDLWSGGGLLQGGMSYIPQFATGGMPEDGLFFANHSELVGQFSGGQTAVANNEQIIQGIERGVYNAMTSALANNNGNGSRDIRVYLDGKEIGAATRRYERNMNRATGVALG